MSKIEINKLHNVDCIEYMKTLQSSSVDLIIADPPYFEICGDFDFVFRDVNDYIEWCKEWLLECFRILKENGSMYLWGKIGFGKGMAFPKLAIWLEENKDFVVQEWITQRNTRGRGTRKGYMSAREELLYLTKSNNYTWNNAYLEEKSNRKDLGADGKPRKNEFKRCSNVWCDITEASQSSKERFKTGSGDSFPTVKAQKLCDRIINASSNSGDLVYIPFAGSGSEIVSCINNNRNWIATEIDEEYIEIIKSRMAKSIDSQGIQN